MPGFKGKRKGGLTLTLYKKPFRYRLPVTPPRKRTKTSSSTPNLKSPSIRAPSLLNNLFQFQNIYILSNGFPQLLKVYFTGNKTRIYIIQTNCTVGLYDIINISLLLLCTWWRPNMSVPRLTKKYKKTCQGM